MSMVNSVPWAAQILNFTGISKFGTTWQQLFDNLGLMPYPAVEGSGAYFVPFPASGRPKFPIGVAIKRDRRGVDLYTQSCASCHSRNLFGRAVVGAGNLQPRSQEFLNFGTSVSDIPGPLLFMASGFNLADYNAFRAAQKNLSFHAAKNPIALGLDTPHASAVLSLMMRDTDEYATKRDRLRLNPRPSNLSWWPSEVKIAPWWLTKYKNRFFVDGSVNGNPALNNFLWIKTSQGIDLRIFEQWVVNNDEKIRDITAAVFASEAPKWTDFFEVTTEDLALAKAGEQIFNDSCAGCHGQYSKAWNTADANLMSNKEQFETVEVAYHENTPVYNVGTDGHRAATTPQMQDDINRLHFTKRFGITIKARPTGAYVPQPLVGVWARWPYLHNGSVPTLCDMLKPAEQRPKKFWVVAADNAASDFDKDCVGFPVFLKSL